MQLKPGQSQKEQYSEFQYSKILEENLRVAKLKAAASSSMRGHKRAIRCPDCGLYGCICQTTLFETEAVWKPLNMFVDMDRRDDDE